MAAEELNRATGAMPSPSILVRSHYALCTATVSCSGPERVTLRPEDLRDSSHQPRKPSRHHIFLHRLSSCSGGTFPDHSLHAESARCRGGRAIFSKRLSTQPRKPGNKQQNSLLSTVQTVHPQEATFSRHQKVMPSGKVMVQNDSPLNGSYFSLTLELAPF